MTDLEVTADLVVPILDEGMPGPPGPPASIPDYLYSTAAPVAGVLTIDLSAGASCIVSMTSDVASLVFTGLPAAGKSRRVAIYFVQDATGGRLLPPSAWPAGSQGPSGVAPLLSTLPNAKDLVMVEAIGAVYEVTQVAAAYSTFS